MAVFCPSDVLMPIHPWLRQSLRLHRVLWHGACIWVVNEQSFDLCCMIELIVSTDEM